MIRFDDDDFDDENKSRWTRFWNREFDGTPLWYMMTMAVVPLYFGMLISRLHYANAVLPWVLGFMIAGGILMLWMSLLRRM